jgi:hypothetical protein
MAAFNNGPSARAGRLDWRSRNGVAVCASEEGTFPEENLLAANAAVGPKIRYPSSHFSVKWAAR